MENIENLEKMNKDDFLEWDNYHDTIVYLDDFFWRQKVRKDNAKKLNLKV